MSATLSAPPFRVNNGSRAPAIRQLDAVHVRVDTIEQAIARSGLGQQPLGAVGYVVGYALAERGRG
ncbi:hypothetical protein ABT174_17925 [Streptomyces sparsogenes]|uniref:hypothetical protein n=1 Tax=Streptomyces sparsogenes TaxID=67365 RepID=UPI003329EB1B